MVLVEEQVNFFVPEADHMREVVTSNLLGRVGETPSRHWIAPALLGHGVPLVLTVFTAIFSVKCL
jgi:hypothetical protein